MRTTNAPVAVEINEPQFPIVAVQIFDTPAPGGTGIEGPIAPDTTNLLQGDGLGGTEDSGINAANLQNLIYRQDIKSIDGSTSPGLAIVAVAELALGTMIIIYSGNHAVLETGPADLTDPGQISPVDYNLSSNNKHWRQVQ